MRWCAYERKRVTIMRTIDLPQSVSSVAIPEEACYERSSPEEV